MFRMSAEPALVSGASQMPFRIAGSARKSRACTSAVGIVPQSSADFTLVFTRVENMVANADTARLIDTVNRNQRRFYDLTSLTILWAAIVLLIGWSRMMEQLFLSLTAGRDAICWLSPTVIRMPAVDSPEVD